MEQLIDERVEQLTDYIMKHCLWQFHSRAWDRLRQNEGILTKTMQILVDEPLDLSTPDDKVYRADAICLAEAYRETYPWINNLSSDEVKSVMAALKERIDFLTVTGSLNAELTDPRY